VHKGGLAFLVPARQLIKDSSRAKGGIIPSQTWLYTDTHRCGSCSTRWSRTRHSSPQHCYRKLAASRQRSALSVQYITCRNQWRRNVSQWDGSSRPSRPSRKKKSTVGFVEKVGFEPGVKERRSDGWREWGWWETWVEKWMRSETVPRPSRRLEECRGDAASPRPLRAAAVKTLTFMEL